MQPQIGMKRFYRRTTNGRPYVIITTSVQFVGDDAHIVPQNDGH